MKDDEFGWDDAKAADNLAAHGVTFETAKRAFRDSFVVEWIDDRFDNGEERFSFLGVVDGRWFVVRCIYAAR